MKNIVALIVTLLFPLNLLAVDITYQVNSGGKASSLTKSYDMSAGSTARSDINLTANPSISSHTNIHAVGEENNIEITTSADDGSASSSASVRILDNVSSADISTSASAANSTSASVTATGTDAQAGLIKGESGGNKTFCAFTGDFNASSDAANGGVSVSSTYENPLSNIYIVTKNPTPCHNPNYTTIQGGVDATDTNGPNYVFVDYGNYAGAAMAGKNSLTLMGVWGADNTIVDGSGGSGDTIAAANSTNLTIEGFTVTGGGSKGGPVSPNGLGYYGTGSGIGIYNSANLRIRDNTAIGNDGAGIFVGPGINFNSNNTKSSGSNNHVEITGNTASDNGLAGIAVVTVEQEIPLQSTKKGTGDGESTEETVDVKGNTVNNNGLIGIGVLSAGDVNVSCNTVTGNKVDNSDFAGIAAGSLSGNVNVSQNTVNEGGAVGVGAVAIDGDATISGNNVSNSDVAGIVGVSVSGDVNVSQNTVTNGGLVGVGAVAIDGDATVLENNVSNSDLAGIAVGSSGNANVSGNTVNGGLVGIGALSGGESNVNTNNVSDTDLAGIAVGSSGDANVSGNTVTDGGFVGIGVLSGGDVNIKGNTVSENGVGVLVLGFSGTANVNENNIYSNTTGLENATSGPVDATNNWWGPGGTGGAGQGGNNDVVNSGGGSTGTIPWSHVRF
jgi:parallel beta-helix repeat protein